MKHIYINDIGKIENGWYVWNQHKDVLTDKNNKEHNRNILYYSNEKRTSYVKHYKGKTINKDVIVFYRGNGNNSFKWLPRIIKYNGSGIIIENHLLYLVPNDGVNINDVFKYINNINTKKYAEKYITSGGLSTKVLENEIPLFIA